MLSGTQMPDAADGRSTRRIQAGREVVRDGPPVLPDLGWIARNEVEQPRVEGEGAALLPPVDPTRAGGQVRERSLARAVGRKDPEQDLQPSAPIRLWHHDGARREDAQLRTCTMNVRISTIRRNQAAAP